MNLTTYCHELTAIARSWQNTKGLTPYLAIRRCNTRTESWEPDDINSVVRTGCRSGLTRSRRIGARWYTDDSGRWPGFRGDSPISGPRRRSRFRWSSFHRRCLPAYRIVGPQTSAGMPSAASIMGVEALPGAFPAPFRGKSDRDCRKTRGNRRSDALLRSRTGEGVLPNAQNQVDVDPAVAPPCAHRGRSHEARRPWPMRAGWPYIDQQPKLPNGPCSSSRLMVVVSRGIPIPLPRRWKTDSASSFQQTMRTGQPFPRSAEP